MKTIQLIICLIFISLVTKGQEKETITAKGFIFFSSSYDKFLDSIKIKDNIDIVYIPDIFIPLNDQGDLKNCSNDTTVINVKKGICLLNIEDRENLKLAAKEFTNPNTKNSCYPEFNYRLLPVEIKYDFFSLDNHVLPCENPIDIQLYNKPVSIHYSLSGVKIISIRKM